MKNAQIIVLIIVVTNTVLVGQIPNGGFEEWIMEENYERPLYWMTNQDPWQTRLEKDTLSVEGNFSLKIMNDVTSAWNGCASLAITNVKFPAALGKYKALTFFVRTVSDSSNTLGTVFLTVSCRVFAKNVILDNFEWRTDEPIEKFTQVIIPLYYANIDSMVISITGGGDGTFNDGCAGRSISWIDALKIDELPHGADDCMELSTYDLGFPRLTFTNMIMHGDTLVVSGIISNNANFSESQLILMRFDTSGAYLDHFVYPDSIGVYYLPTFGDKKRGLCRAQDGGYMLLNQVGSKGMVIHIDRNGQKLWQKTYDDPVTVSEDFKKIVPVDDGYLVAGRKRRLNYLYEIFVMKIDINGNLIWEYNSEDGNKSVNDLVVLNANEFVISGSTRYETQSDKSLYVNHVFALDNTGHLNWQWDSDLTFDQSMRGLIYNTNGFWSYPVISNEFGETYMHFMPKFVIRDRDMNLLTERELDDADSGSNYLMDMIPLHDGGYLGTGVNFEKSAPKSHTYTWMLKIDSGGDIVWERKDLVFPDTVISTSQNVHSAVELAGGNIIAAGSYYVSGSAFGILMKVDRCGCIDTFCTALTFAKELLPLPSQVNVYPNPAYDHLIIELRDEFPHAIIEIYDFTGRCVLMKEIYSGDNSLLLDEISAGDVYVWRVVSDKGDLLGVDKFFLEHQ